MTVFPPTIEKYRVTDTTPSRDLLTLGRFYSEAGGYASSILDKAHQSFARKCLRRYEKVVDTLIDREVIFTPNDLWVLPKGEFDISDLSSLTIEQLETQYLLCSSARDKRSKTGRESFTYFLEGRIVNELSKRQASNQSEKIRIEYCKGLYRNELENLAFIIRKPEKNLEDVKIFRSNQDYSSEQLVALVKLYRKFNSVAERETFVQCVDKALDLIENSVSADDLMELASELADPACNRNIQIPEWIYSLMLNVMKHWTRRHHLPHTDIVMPMLAYAMHTSEWEWQHKAGRIINRCYRHVINQQDDDMSIGEKIENLYIAMVCYQFVSKLSCRKIVSAWNKLCSKIIESGKTLSVGQIYKLIEAANEFSDFEYLSKDLKDQLIQRLRFLSESDNIEAKAYIQILERKKPLPKAV